MQITRTKNELKNHITPLKEQRKIIGFVPTMGALHEGHGSLIKIAKQEADIVIVSIFVNPAQFAANEDFDKYPRTEERDLHKLQEWGVDIVYLPDSNEIYSKDFAIKISVGAIGQQLEGAFRPHFFDGVALIVTKLFMQIMPDIALFGQKDYQQLMIIKKLVRELDMPVKIIGAPIIREEDGLAMSSRNIYLSASDRIIAANLYLILNKIKQRLNAGDEIQKTILESKEQLLTMGFAKVDYIKLCNSETLSPLELLAKPARILAAASISGVRLLDNIEV